MTPSAWSGWRDYNHQREVCAALFGPTWSLEDEATLVSFINETWGDRRSALAPTKQEEPVAVKEAVALSLDGLPPVQIESLHFFKNDAPAPFDAPAIKAMARELLAYRTICRRPLYYTSPSVSRDAGDDDMLTMWADLIVDDGGRNAWRCNEASNRDGPHNLEVMELSSLTFPIGTKIKITEPMFTDDEDEPPAPEHGEGMK
jgi:hypothetical protein